MVNKNHKPIKSFSRGCGSEKTAGGRGVLIKDLTQADADIEETDTRWIMTKLRILSFSSDLAGRPS